MRSTRAEVAKLAGVSPSVVSYVLNGGPRNVAPETRRRVEEAIASLEYRPNAIAQALRGGRSGAIGVIVGGGEDGLFRAVSGSLQRAAASYGYAMYVSFAGDPAGERQYARSLVDRQVDALIAVEPAERAMLGELRDDGLPVAVIGEAEAPAGLLSLRTDPSRAGRELLSAVAGREATAIVHSDGRTPWLTGAEIAVAAAPGVSVIGLDLDTVEGGVELLRVLGAHPRAVVMCATDPELRRVRWLVGSAGLDPDRHVFASGRVDFRDDPAAAADVEVRWDLDRPVDAIFGELIRMIDDPDLEEGAVELPWTIVSGEEAPQRAARVWDVIDM